MKTQSATITTSAPVAGVSVSVPSVLLPPVSGLSVAEPSTEGLPEILTLKETAAFFRVSARHIQNLMVRGLPHFRLGVLVRFRREDIWAYLANAPFRARHKRRKESYEPLPLNADQAREGSAKRGALS